jgi:hypothetical protein
MDKIDKKHDFITHTRTSVEKLIRHSNSIKDELVCLDSKHLQIDHKILEQTKVLDKLKHKRSKSFAKKKEKEGILENLHSQINEGTDIILISRQII